MGQPDCSPLQGVLSVIWNLREARGTGLDHVAGGARRSGTRLCAFMRWHRLDDIHQQQIAKKALKKGADGPWWR